MPDRQLLHYRLGRPTPCPVGTFGSTTLLTSLASCNSCTAGRFCGSQGFTSTSGNCSAGFYCTLRAQVAQPTDGVTGNVCPMGSACPAGIRAPVNCKLFLWLLQPHHIPAPPCLARLASRTRIISRLSFVQWAVTVHLAPIPLYHRAPVGPFTMLEDCIF